jgi:DnaJ-class molecular chaperone
MFGWFNSVTCPECGGKGNENEPSHWCDDCLQKAKDWYDNLPDGYKWTDEDIEEMEKW